MITVTHRTTAGPDAVWSILADGWSYASWVVGASRIRAVAANWPDLGATVHHSAGSWPVLLHDNTEVTAVRAGEMIRLRARTRPLGEAVVEIEISPDASGSLITMREDVSGGPARLIPRLLRHAALAPRNTESLLRLALLAERSESPDDAVST